MLSLSGPAMMRPRGWERVRKVLRREKTLPIMAGSVVS
jgi:hypothetical protein